MVSPDWAVEAVASTTVATPSVVGLGETVKLAVVTSVVTPVTVIVDEAVPVASAGSVTVSTTVKMPVAPNVWLVVMPVPVEPSPKSHG